MRIDGREAAEKTPRDSYVPTLVGSSKQTALGYLYCASQEGATSVGVWFGKWKLEAKQQPKDDWRLYDLRHRRNQQRRETTPQVVQQILDLLKRDGLL